MSRPSHDDELRSLTEKLRTSEERLRLALEGAQAGIWEVSFDLPATYWSPEYRALYGFDVSEAASREKWETRLHPDDCDRVRANIRAAEASDTTRYEQEFRIVHPQRGERWLRDIVRIRRAPDGRVLSTGGINIDITDRKRAEADLRSSEERLLLAADVAGFGTFDRDLRTGTHVWSPKMYQLAGIPEGTHVSFEDIFRLVDPSQQAALQAAYSEAYDPAGKGELSAEYRFQRPDGEVRWASVKGRTFFEGEDASRRAVRLVGAAQDITERKRVEETLTEQKRDLEAQVAERTAERDRMWRRSRDLLAIATLDTVFVAVNPAWERLLGWTEAEIVGRPAATFKHPDDAERTRAELDRLARGIPTESFEDRYRGKDGRWRWISWAIMPEKGLLYCSGRDVTEERRQKVELEQTQEALRQAQKMEAMGQLTGGVAHDFNNLLTPIIGGLDLLQRRGAGDERTQRTIAGALQSAERARMLVQRLLAFARRQPLQPTAVDVIDLEKGLTELLTSTLGPRIEIATEFEPGVPPARADANQLEMAILNLAVNARDAMPEGGRLTLTVASETVGSGHRTRLPPGPYVRIAVADTGVGMDEATRRRAVEPFFSTKGVGRGTGLGLSMAHGLAAQLGGALHLDSRPGAGTTVELWLPAAEQKASPPAAPHEAKAEAAAGTVLLIDDEELVRVSTADMLADLGYHVVETKSAEEALDLIDGGLVMDAVVTDHLMPGMTGTELAHRVRTARPGIPVLVISGYADIEGIEPGLPRLTKPFRQTDLAACLSSILRRKTAPVPAEAGNGD